MNTSNFLGENGPDLSNEHRNQHKFECRSHLIAHVIYEAVYIVFCVRFLSYDRFVNDQLQLKEAQMVWYQEYTRMFS